MCGIVFCHDHATTGVLVETVNDAWTHFSSDATEIGDVVQQGVDQCAIWIALSGVDDKAVGLVEHDDVIVFKQNRQWHILRLDGYRGDFGDGEVNGITKFQSHPGFGRRAIEGGVAVFDQILETRAR